MLRHQFATEALETDPREPPTSIPVILAYLRRKGEGSAGIDAARELIDAISGASLTRRYIDAHKFVEIVRALRRATMEQDATQLLEDIGRKGYPVTLLELAASFGKSEQLDRDRILGSVATGSWQHLASTIKLLPQSKGLIQHLSAAKVLDIIIFGIPDGQHTDIAEYLQEQGLNEAANRVLELEGCHGQGPGERVG
jgi:hypothetical protein